MIRFINNDASYHKARQNKDTRWREHFGVSRLISERWKELHNDKVPVVQQIYHPFLSGLFPSFVLVSFCLHIGQGQTGRTVVLAQIRRKVPYQDWWCNWCVSSTNTANNYKDEARRRTSPITCTGCAAEAGGTQVTATRSVCREYRKWDGHCREIVFELRGGQSWTLPALQPDPHEW